MLIRAFAVATLALFCAAMPRCVLAVDRQLGADVPKPGVQGAPWSADAKTRVARDVDALLGGAVTLRGGHSGLLAIDTRSGDVVFERRADDAFVPASTLKLLTGSVALATLGAAFRFHTEAHLTPQDRTLYLRAGGDPLLRTADLQAMVAAAVATGGFAPAGRLLLDASAFDAAPYPRGWSWDDFPYDYAAKLSPLPIDENAIELTVSAGSKIGAPLTVRAKRSAAADDSLAREHCQNDPASLTPPVALTGAAGMPADIDVVRDLAGKCFNIVGSLPLGGPPQTLEVARSEPALYLHEFAPANGDFSGSLPLPSDARLIWTHDGEPLSDLLADMWWPSDNFVAELLLREIGLHENGKPGTTEHGAAAERVWLASIGVDPATLDIADGSGLSVYDRLTPRALVAILQADWNAPYRDAVLDDLPLAGVRGTLQNSFVGSLAERRTFAKTGSVSHARGLAGYLATLHHGALTFAWSVDDWMGEDADLAALRARVLSRFIGD